jgi:glucose-6-phosphate isomerase
MDDLLADVEAAAGFAVYGGSPAAQRRELLADGVPGLLAGKDPTLWGTAGEATATAWLGWVDAYRRSRELLPQLAELCEELADLDEVVVTAPATAASAIARSLGVPMTVLARDDPPRVTDAVADPDRLSRTVVVLTEDAEPLRTAFWQAHLGAGRTEAEASRHFVAVAAPGSALEAAAHGLGVIVLPAEAGVTGPWAALTASALVPAALAGVDVAELLDEAELLAPSLAGETDNPALALGVALGAAHRPVALVSDGTGFEGLGEWAAELLAGVVAVGSGGLTVTYGGALSPAAVPGGGTRPDVAVNGPLGAHFLAWQFATATAARILGKDPSAVN